jgi:lipopolysaccharide export system permease protein
LNPSPEQTTGSGTLPRPRLLPVFHLYIFRELSGTLLLAFGIVMGILFLFTALEVGRREGVDVTALLFMAPHIIPFGLKYALPVALLLAVTFTFSRLAADNEITALRAAGSSLWPIVAPVILIALLLSFLLLGVTMVWLPQSHVAKRDIIRRAGLNVLQNLPAGEQQLHFGPFWLAYRDARGDVLSDVVICQTQKTGGLQLQILAKEGRWDWDPERGILRFELTQSQWTVFNPKKGREQKFYPDVVTFPLQVESLVRIRPARTRDFSYSRILGLREVLRDTPSRLHPSIFRWKSAELEYELHNRFAVSFSPFIMALLGMPFGVRVRQRGKLAAFFAGFIPVVAFYYPLTLIGEGLGTEGQLSPPVAAWGAAVIVGAIGAILTWRMMFR